MHYLEGQITKLGVNIERYKDVDVKHIEKSRPNVVLAAAGGCHTVADMPEIQGSIDKAEILGLGMTFTMRDHLLM
jgi:hypothetical protein